MTVSNFSTLCSLNIAVSLLSANFSLADTTDDLFKALDANNDGRITSDEVKADSKRHFDRLLRLGDRDFDGILTQEEFRDGIAEPAPPVNQFAIGRFQNRRPQNIDPERVFQFLDQNNDGKITLAEMPEQAKQRMKPLFDRIGKDSISKTEFDRFRAARMKMNGTPAPGNQPGASKSNSKRESTAKKQAGKPAKGKRPAAMEKPAQGRLASMMINRLDRNEDGGISKSEAPDRMKQNFDRLDANGDGKISAVELGRVMSRRAKSD